MKKYMGNKKEVLLFYLLMIAVIGWFVVAETVYPSEEINDDHYGQKHIISD